MEAQRGGWFYSFLFHPPLIFKVRIKEIVYVWYQIYNQESTQSYRITELKEVMDIVRWLK